MCVAAIEAFRHHRGRASAQRDHRGLRRLLADGWPATRSCAGWGQRKASSTSRSPRSSTRCGTCYGESRRQAGVEAAGGHDAQASRVVHRLPLHHRRLTPEEARRDARPPGARRRPIARRELLRTGIRRTRRRSDGWVTRTTRCARRAVTPSQRAGRISRSRSAPTRQTMRGVWGSCATQSARTRC